MRSFALTLLICLTTAAGIQAQRTRVPAFSEYRAKVERARVHPVDLASDRHARMFRTNLREAAKGKVNFAGHFILVTWGCGTNCNDGAIIDARTGRVFFPKELSGIGIGLGSWSTDVEPLVFKPESRMLVINGLTGGSRLEYNTPREGIHYLLWSGTAFREIKFVQKRSEK